jgi:hypothetical protein
MRYRRRGYIAPVVIHKQKIGCFFKPQDYTDFHEKINYRHRLTQIRVASPYP